MRGVAAWSDQPIPTHPDERFTVAIAQRMVETGDPHPGFFNYPTFTTYLLACIFGATRLAIGAEGWSQLEPIDPYLMGRAVVAILSAGTILVAYALGRRLSDRKGGLVAACFMAVFHPSGHAATVDPANGLWCGVAVLMALRVAQGETGWRTYGMAGVAIGLAAGSKYTGALCASALAAGHLAVGPRTAWVRLVGAAAVSVVVFIFTTPFAVLEPAALMNALQQEHRHYSSGHLAWTAQGSSHLAHLEILFDQYLGHGPTVLVVLGVLVLARSRPASVMVAITFPLIGIGFLGLYPTVFGRNLVPIMAPLAALYGAGTLWTARFASSLILPNCNARNRYAAVAVVVLTVWSLKTHAAGRVKLIQYLRRPDTRWISLQWIDKNLPPGSRVGREQYTPAIEDHTDRFDVAPLGKSAVAFRRESIEALDYMVTSEADAAFFDQQPERYPEEAAAYQAFRNRHELVRQFERGPATRGPRIRVYRIVP